MLPEVRKRRIVVARGLQILPHFAVFFRAKLLIFFRISTSYRTTNQ